VKEFAESPRKALLETRYRELVVRLNELYRPHVQFEDESLMRLARRTLDHAEIESISREMMARRRKAELDRSSLDDQTAKNPGGLLGMHELTRTVLMLYIAMVSNLSITHSIRGRGKRPRSPRASPRRGNLLKSILATWRREAATSICSQTKDERGSIDSCRAF
jgi:hypothetical protein